MVAQRGYSVLELLIALALGLILFTGVGVLMLSSSRGWILQNELSMMQENARLASFVLQNHITTAGYTGCPVNTPTANAVTAGSDTRQWMIHIKKGIVGFPLSQTKKYIDSKALSEAVVVFAIDDERVLFATTHDANSAKLTAGMPSFTTGDLLAIRDAHCRQLSYVVATGGTLNNDIFYNVNASPTLLNCSEQLGGNYDCDSAALLAEDVDLQGSQLLPMTGYAFYIRNSNGIPTLYRKPAGEYSNGQSVPTEAMVEGVEKMVVHYGLDSNNDGIANRFVSADELDEFDSRFASVITVRIELLLRSLETVAPEPQIFVFDGAEQTAADNYVRRVFSKTFTLRNRSAS